VCSLANPREVFDVTSQRKRLFVISLICVLGSPLAIQAQPKKKLSLAELAALEWKLEQAAKALTQNPKVEARKKAIDELLSTKDVRAIKPMAMALKEDPNAGVRLKAAEGLGTFKSPETLGLLKLASTADPDPKLREAAAALVKKFPRRMKTAALPLKARPFDPPRGRLTAKKINGVLSAPSGDARLWAVRQCGKLKFKGRVKRLEYHLQHDPSGRVRVESARLLVKIQKKKALPALIKVVADGDPAVRFELARIMAKFDDSGALKVLQQMAAADTNETVRAEAKDLLEPVTKIGKRLLKDRIKMLSSPNPTMRIQALNSLKGFTHWRAMLPMSCALINDKSMPVRATAIKILPDMHDYSVLTALRVSAMLEQDKKLKGTVRRTVIALFKKGKGLVRQLSHKDPNGRARAARALAQGGYDEGALIKALKDKSAKVRLAAALGLRNSVSSKAINALKMAGADSNRRVRRVVDKFFKGQKSIAGWRKFFKSPHKVITWTVDKNAWNRRMAAHALGVMGAEQGEHSLVMLLKNDKDINVRLAAVWALVLMGTEKAENAIKKAAGADKNEKVRIAARKYTVISDGKVKAEDMVAQLQDDKASVREDAADALSLQASSKVLYPLVRGALCDSNARSREAAMRGLARIGNKLAKHVLRMAMIRDLDPNVRRSAKFMLILAGGK